MSVLFQFCPDVMVRVADPETSSFPSFHRTLSRASPSPVYDYEEVTPLLLSPALKLTPCTLNELLFSIHTKVNSLHTSRTLI